MKKKSIISILLVFLILVVSHNIWLTIKPKASVAVAPPGGLTVLDGNSTAPVKHPRPSIKFDAMMFIIIAILSYLLSYRLTSYLADFKIEKHYSRIDIVFLAVCAVIMYLPMSHISDAKKSEAENRNLAVWKPLIKKDGSINYSFGRDYDKWFSDRFNCREQLFTLYVKTFVLPNRYPKFADKIWNKKENVFLYTIFGKMEQRLSVSDLKIKLEALKDFLDKRNIKLVLYLVPDREFLMNEDERYPLLKIKTDKIEKLIAELTDINIHFDIDIYRKEQAINSLIYHTDHHLNEYGSYIVYKNICKELGVQPVSLDDYETIKSQKIRESLFLQDIFFNGSLLKGFPVLNVRESLLDTEYIYYKYKHQKDIKVTAIPDVKLCYEVYNPLADSNEKIYVIHNSYGENVLKFLQTNYKYMINRRYNWIGGRDFSNVPFLSDIEKYKPDTVLIIIDSYVLGQIMGLKLAD